MAIRQHGIAFFEFMCLTSEWTATFVPSQQPQKEIFFGLILRDLAGTTIAGSNLTAFD